VDFHIVEAEKTEVRSKKFEVVDYRNAKDLPQVLATVKCQPSILVWAEGEEKKASGGADRNELESAEALAIWTIPPSPEELRAALDKVHPQTVYLFTVTEPFETPEAFLGRLAGLLKYAINRRGGKVTYTELEAATAQRAVTVRNGMEWLVAQGEISLIEKEDELVVSIVTSLKDPAGASRLWTEIQSLMAETAAYRAHFKRADKETLFSG
jgi:hypothetical protein